MQEWVMRKLEEIYEDDGKIYLAATLKNKSKREVLDEILNYEGFIGYTQWILDLIEGIYGIKLEG